MFRDTSIRNSAIIVVCAWVAVLVTGLLSPEPMIGDEVTHYYMLVSQADSLPVPSFDAVIPGGLGGEAEIRYYPHTFLWHYLGAILYACWSSPIITQIYHSLFLLQLLLAVLYLSKKVAGYNSAGVNLALLSVGSLPMTLIFSVAYYLDVPAAAQIMTAMCFILRKKWVKGALFMSLAVAMKENMLLFLPGYMLIAAAVMNGEGKKRMLLSMAGTLAAVLLGCWVVALALRACAPASYYPADMLKALWNRVYLKCDFLHQGQVGVGEVEPVARAQAYLKQIEQMHQPSNHPGDLRIPRNWLIYGGGVLWAMLSISAVGSVIEWRRRFKPLKWFTPGSAMLLLGLSYMVLVYLNLGVPEVRFFMPGVVCCCIPIAGCAARIPKARLLLIGLAVAAVLQSAAVLHKTYSLRHLPEGIKAAVAFLERDPPVPNKVFMYPEGSYRFFSCAHTWYLGGRLKDFWRADNDQRLELLRRNGVGAVVVKKHLVGPIDKEMKNLGVYPDFFIQDIEDDPRFTKALENEDVTIYRLPASGQAAQ